MQGGNNAFNRVIEQDGADTDLHAELETVCRAEKRFVLADRFALVIKDHPAASDPAWIGDRASFDQRPRLGLDLLLDLATEAVGVTEAVLDLGLLAGLQVRVVGFPRQRVYDSGFRVGLVFCPLVGEQVINQSRGGTTQYCMWISERVGQMVEFNCFAQVRLETTE